MVVINSFLLFHIWGKKNYFLFPRAHFVWLQRIHAMHNDFIQLHVWVHVAANISSYQSAYTGRMRLTAVCCHTQSLATKSTIKSSLQDTAAINFHLTSVMLTLLQIHLPEKRICGFHGDLRTGLYQTSLSPSPCIFFFSCFLLLLLSDPSFISSSSPRSIHLSRMYCTLHMIKHKTHWCDKYFIYQNHPADSHPPKQNYWEWQ